MKKLIKYVAIGCFALTFSACNSIHNMNQYYENVNEEAFEYCLDKGNNHYEKNGCYFKYKVQAYKNTKKELEHSIGSIEKSWLDENSQYKYDGEIKTLNDPIILTKEEYEQLKKDMDEMIIKKISKDLGVSEDEAREGLRKAKIKMEQDKLKKENK